uniref:Uncharacterized protein n=1 Tax=Oryza meridionalis TaxID=40149 RepID=A0A0E0D0G4_9ORYZ
MMSVSFSEGVGGAVVRRLGLQPSVGGRLHAHLQQVEGRGADGKPAAGFGKDAAANHGNAAKRYHHDGDDYASTKCSGFGWCK